MILDYDESGVNNNLYLKINFIWFRIFIKLVECKLLLLYYNVVIECVIIFLYILNRSLFDFKDFISLLIIYEGFFIL